jgi:ubiquinone/menaquinone biosynthesis C-methylase UbiE
VGATDIWHEIGHQFRNPTGVSGRVIGNVMRVINRRPNSLAIAALELKAADSVLELGCGPGSAINAMCRLAPLGVVHGLDQSPVMLAQAALVNSMAVRSHRAVLHQGSFERIPLANASVDKVLAVNVIYFWNDMPAILREIRRVLRSGGIVSIYATDSSAMKSWKFAGPETHRLFDAVSLAACLRDGGFGDFDVNVTRVRAGLGVPGLIARVRGH